MAGAKHRATRAEKVAAYARLRDAHAEVFDRVHGKDVPAMREWSPREIVDYLRGFLYLPDGATDFDVLRACILNQAYLTDQVVAPPRLVERPRRIGAWANEGA